jgi:hypothetical protein
MKTLASLESGVLGRHGTVEAGPTTTAVHRPAWPPVGGLQVWLALGPRS